MAKLEEYTLIVTKEGEKQYDPETGAYLEFSKMPKIDYDKMYKEEDAWLQAALQRTYDLPEGEIVGAVINFPVADGRAWYLVTKDKPLTLQHVDIGDAYAIPNAHVRGLNRDDVLQQVNSIRAWHRLVEKKKEEPQ